MTAETKPRPAELALIIDAAGGTVLDRPPTNASGPTVVVSTEDERLAWAPLSKLKHVRVVKAEHLLTCVLRQRLEIGARDTLRA